MIQQLGTLDVKLLMIVLLLPACLTPAEKVVKQVNDSPFHNHHHHCRRHHYHCHRPSVPTDGGPQWPTADLHKAVSRKPAVREGNATKTDMVLLVGRMHQGGVNAVDTWTTCMHHQDVCIVGSSSHPLPVTQWQAIAH